MKYDEQFHYTHPNGATQRCRTCNKYLDRCKCNPGDSRTTSVPMPVYEAPVRRENVPEGALQYIIYDHPATGQRTWIATKDLRKGEPFPILPGSSETRFKASAQFFSRPDGLVGELYLPEKEEVNARRCTHPTIHLEYYAWRRDMSEFDRRFIDERATPDVANALLMFAWTRSRERLRQPAPIGSEPDWKDEAHHWRHVARAVSVALAGTDIGTPEKFAIEQTRAISNLLQERDYLKQTIKGYELTVTKDRMDRDRYKAQAEALEKLLAERDDLLKTALFAYYEDRGELFCGMRDDSGSGFRKDEVNRLKELGHFKKP